MADITFEAVLELAEQLMPEEQEKLIAQLQAQQTKRPAPFQTECTVNNLAELYSIIFNKDNIFKNSHDLFIFRGQADGRWGLVPSIFRGYNLSSTNKIELQDQKVVDTNEFLKIANLQALEKTIYREFFERIRAYPQLRVNPHAPWELLCLAQHFGVPTRLLDWTGNLNIAAYVCVAEVLCSEKDGAIWCLNASLISENQNPRGDDDPFNGLFYDKEERISRIDDLPLPTSFFPHWKESQKTPEDTAYGFRILRAPAIDDRIKNQNSFFTVDVTKRGMVDRQDDALIHYDQIQLCSDYLLKIIIPANAKKPIKDNLESLGIDYSVVFPDLFGLGRYFQDFRENLVQPWTKKNSVGD